MTVFTGVCSGYKTGCLGNPNLLKAWAVPGEPLFLVCVENSKSLGSDVKEDGSGSNSRGINVLPSIRGRETLISSADCPGCGVGQA